MVSFILDSLNQVDIKDYLKESKLIMLSKTGSSEVEMENIRPIKVLSYPYKIMEKAIKNKLD